MTSATMAVIGFTEIVLLVAAGLMLVGTPVAVIVGLWLWRRGQKERSA